jgi:hypothetical protein
MAKLSHFSIGILKNNPLNLTPGHGLTFLVKQRALLLADKSRFTDESRLSALRVDTNFVASVTVNAFRQVFDRLGHINKKVNDKKIRNFILNSPYSN